MTEKQATGVNTIWVRAGTIFVSIGFGATEALSEVEQVIVAAGSSVLIPVTGDYISWKAEDGVSTGSVYIEQSVAR